MPLYDYDCAACGTRFEVVHGVHADPPTTCPVCGKGPVKKAFSAPTIHFKGSGWAKKERRATSAPSASSGKDGSSGSSKGGDGSSRDSGSRDGGSRDSGSGDSGSSGGGSGDGGSSTTSTSEGASSSKDSTAASTTSGAASSTD